MQWAQFGFAPQGGRCNPYEHTLSPQTVSKLRVAWRVTSDTFGAASPAVANGLVYIATYGSGRLYALRIADGSVAWSASTPVEAGTAPTSPAIAGRLVFVGATHTVYAFDAERGTLVWRYDTGNLVQSSLTVADGMVYTASFAEVGPPNTLSALDQASGTVRWRLRLSTLGASAPAVVGTTAYLTITAEDGSTTLQAMDALTGTVLWHVPVEGASTLPPTISGGILYISGGTSLHFSAYSAITGAPLWSVAPSNAVYAAPAVANGIVYVGSSDGIFYAMDAQSGRTRWSVYLNAGGVITSSAAVANGVVYIGVGCDCGTATDARVYALDARTGGPLWQFAPGYAIFSSPVVVNGTLYVSAYTGMFAFRV
jgi:outer membrane protein assembly factor BamB